MADKSIGELPQATQVQPESLIPLEQDGQAMRMSGEQFADFAKESVAPIAQEATAAAAAAEQAADRAGAARDSIVLDEQKMAQAVKDAAGSAESAKAAGESAVDSAIQARSSALASESSFMQAQLVAQDVEDAKKVAQMSASSAGTAREYAQSAADRAENAARTVESIVAGNEAYTKRESDLRFAVPIVEGASGAVVAVTDSAERPLQGLKVFGKTTQDGTPAPDAPVELESVGDDGNVAVTVCGKNLLQILGVVVDRVRNGITQTVNPDGSLTYSGTAEGLEPSFGFGNNINSENSRKIIIASGYYTLSIPVRPDNVDVVRGFMNIYYDGVEHQGVLNAGKRNNYTSTAKITDEMLSYDDFRIAYGFWSDDNFAWNNGTYALQLEYGTTATAYEPYKPAQTLTVSTPNGLPGIPVTSGGNYTDANGQKWICDEVDFARGVYVQRVKVLVFDGTETGFSAYNTAVEGKYRMGMRIPDAGIQDEGLADKLASSHYPVVSTDATWNCRLGVSRQLKNNSKYLFVYDDNYQTVDAWKAFLSEQYAEGTPVEIQYPLATPIETPLTGEELAQYASLHTNKPNTTVSNDGGAGIEVSYVADTKLYIDNKFAQLAAAVVNNA